MQDKTPRFSRGLGVTHGDVLAVVMKRCEKALGRSRSILDLGQLKSMEYPQTM